MKIEKFKNKILAKPFANITEVTENSPAWKAST